MSGSKKIFLALSVLFIVLLIWVSIDISKRTTFPGSQPQLRQRIEDTYIKNSENVEDTIQNMNDTIAIDSGRKQISD